MKVNLFIEGNKSTNQEYYYGAMVNKNIKDVYMGYCFLKPKQRKKIGPGKGHEEIIMLIEGVMMFSSKEDIMMKKGDAIHIPEGTTIEVENLTDKDIYFVIAGGHPVPHSHDGHTH